MPTVPTDKNKLINWWITENELLTPLVLKKMNFYVSFLQQLKKKKKHKIK